MTCAGVLGLAVGHGVAADAALVRDPKAGPRDIAKDPKTVLALRALSTAVGEPVGKWAARGVKPAMGAGGRAYYFLWSLERVCVALNLETINKKDWYAWGSEVLLANQQPNGAWMGDYGTYGADTCFALLFLKRANLARDLSARLKGGDPRELRGGGVGGSGLASDPVVRLSPTGIGDKSSEKKPGEGKTETPPREKLPGKRPPDEGREPSRVSEDSPAGLARELEKAAAGRRGAVLTRLRDGKGVAFTEALAGAIPRLDGDSKKQARDALAERLARMNLSTLRSYLKDEDTEIRRASAIACAMQEDKAYVPDLIRLLSDPEQTVERAAVAALRELTGQNFGPAPSASRAERAKAVAAWEAWWRKQTRE